MGPADRGAHHRPHDDRRRRQLDRGLRLTAACLKVGPESAGADPGPAATARAGPTATVTDANLVLGRLNPTYFLGGEIPLDADARARAVEPIAERLGLRASRTPRTRSSSVAIENMAGAVRLVCVDRGLDYRRFDLVAFGGAGPLHAAEIARRVGLDAASSCRHSPGSPRPSARWPPTCASTVA